MITDLAGFGGRLRPAGVRPAVLVVDAIVGFTNPERPLGSDATVAVGAMQAVVDRARVKQLPVMFTAIAYRPDMSDAGLWPMKVPALADLIAGTPAVEVDERLGRLPDERVIIKKGPSACHGTDLSTTLRNVGATCVILCGLTTSGCVRATAVDLLQDGFPVLVPRECVSDRDAAAHEASLRDLDLKYADVVSVHDVLNSGPLAPSDR